jgi:eukaryotic-like serine/threonine-protein kinase
MNDNAASPIESVLDRQKLRWLGGSRPSVAELLEDYSLRVDSEIRLDLIYNEILIREELDETPTVDEYVAEHPDLEDEIKLHFDVHRALGGSVVESSTPPYHSGTVPSFAGSLIEWNSSLCEYDILGELGRGGMGIVFKARQRRLNRLVAVKTLHPGRNQSPRERVRFRREAQSVARLQHPNIVQIFEVGEENGLPFLVLELVDNGTLAEKLRGLPLTPYAAAELVETLARAVQHAHERHIIHRDLKPANVLLTKNGIPKISDFGLARILEENALGASLETGSGEPVGTPRYMAPEQAAGQRDQIGPATDVHALGTILYECLTGQVPFVATSPLDTMDKIRHDEPVSPRRRQSSIARDLATICLRCLHKRPGRRYASARALADDLRRFLDGKPIEARATPMLERVWMWSRRRPAQAALAAVGILLVFTSLAAFDIQQQRDKKFIAQKRSEITTLVQEAKDSLAEHDDRTANEKLLMALAKTRDEPQLIDCELAVRGWLDQGLRMAEQQRWKRRQPPPLFDERRDEAILRSIILDPHRKESTQAVHDQIESALTLIGTDDSAYRVEREQLKLIEAGVLLREGQAADALALLDETRGIASRLWLQCHADCLEQLGHQAEAVTQRLKAEQLAPEDALEYFLSGLDRCGRADWAAAVSDFDRVLDREPEHFVARYLQALCYLQLRHPIEAKVALTACIGQRPNFVWNFISRTEAWLQVRDYAAAAQDLQRAREMKPNEAAKLVLKQTVDQLRKAIERLPDDAREALGREKIVTDSGTKFLKDLQLFEDSRGGRPE